MSKGLRAFAQPRLNERSASSPLDNHPKKHSFVSTSIRQRIALQSLRELAQRPIAAIRSHVRLKD